MIKTAMVLAAGRGERLRPYTDHTPKPLLPLGGCSMLERLLVKLKAAGIERCVINICYLADRFIETLGNGRELGLEIIWSREHQALGAGGGLVNAKAYLGDAPFVLASGDIVCDYDFTRLTRHRLPPDCLAHAVMVPNPLYHPHGDWALDQGYLRLTGAKYTFSALAVMDPKLLQQQESAFSMGDVFRSAIEQGQASGELFLGPYHNVGTVAEYQYLQDHYHA